LAAAIAANSIDSDEMIVIANPKQAEQIRYLAGPAYDNSRVFGTAMVPDKRVIGVAPAPSLPAILEYPPSKKSETRRSNLKTPTRRTL
jgi:hypothetical protein